MGHFQHALRLVESVDPTALAHLAKAMGLPTDEADTRALVAAIFRAARGASTPYAWPSRTLEGYFGDPRRRYLALNPSNLFGAYGTLEVRLP